MEAFSVKGLVFPQVNNVWPRRPTKTGWERLEING